MEKIKILLLEDVDKFLSSIPLKAKNKVLENVRKISGGVKDSELFKKLEGATDIWELRTKYNSTEYRLLAFWDKDSKSLIVATHGFIKKRWSIPKKEIERADELRRIYYKLK